jgi:hypothetical protein
MRAYYYRHHEAILLRKAYQRYVSGRTKKLHKTTTQQLIDAGFDMPQMASGLNTLDDPTAPTLPLGSLTAGIEVSYTSFQVASGRIDHLKLDPGSIGFVLELIVAHRYRCRMQHRFCKLISFIEARGILHSIADRDFSQKARTQI